MAVAKSVQIRQRWGRFLELAPFGIVGAVDTGLERRRRIVPTTGSAK
jgi:hypothetical protein